MAKEKFERRLLYVGPVSSFSILAASGNGDQVAPIDDTRPLITGEVYDDLPPDHPVIKNLIAHKLLVTPPDDVSDAAPAKTAVSDSGTTKSGDIGRASATPDKPAK